MEMDSSLSGINNPGAHFAARKNFYNTPIWSHFARAIPQELKIEGLVVGVNCYGTSPWHLGWQEETGLLLDNVDQGISLRPELIPDLNVFQGNARATRLANLYGGAALAFFSPRSCYFFADGSQCKFCSLAGTAAETQEFKNMLSEEDVRETVRATLQTDRHRIEQIMIVGGTVRELDRGFQHHLSLAKAALMELDAQSASETVSIHISTMPPRDLDLIEELKEFPDIEVMFNLEVWTEESFARICPGKDRDYGRSNILKALERLRDVIGPYRAHSLLVTGLESAEYTIEGATQLAGMGVSPIINVYHSDRHSALGLGPRPSFDELSHVAMGLQTLYDVLPLRPYWKQCGRNAIDAEAKRGLFHNGLLDTLQAQP